MLRLARDPSFLRQPTRPALTPYTPDDSIKMDFSWHYSWSGTYQERLTKLRDKRYSFITTPSRASKMYSRLIVDLVQASQHVTFWTALTICFHLTAHLTLTVVSFAASSALGYGLALLADLGAKRDIRRRTPHDLVVVFAAVMGSVHISTVMALSTFLYSEIPLTYPARLAAGLGFVCVVVSVLFGGGVVLVALWKMWQAALDMMYWDVGTTAAAADKPEDGIAAND